MSQVIDQNTKAPIGYIVSLLATAGTLFVAWGQMAQKVDMAITEIKETRQAYVGLQSAMTELQRTVAYQQAVTEQCRATLFRGDSRR